MKIRELIDDMKDTGSGDRVRVGELLARLQGRSLGALLTLIALVNVIPLISWLPGVLAITGFLLIIASAQSMFARNASIWLPERIAAMTIERDRLEKGLEKAKPWFGWLDNLVRERFSWLVNAHAAALSAVLLALLFFPLGFVPWGVVVPVLAIVFLGLSLIGRDGIAALIGYGFAIGSVWLVWQFAPEAVAAVRDLVS